MATTPVFLPGESHGRRSLVGCSPWGRTELDHDWSDLAAAAAAIPSHNPHSISLVHNSNVCLNWQSPPASFSHLWYLDPHPLEIPLPHSPLTSVLLYPVDTFESICQSIWQCWPNSPSWNIFLFGFHESIFSVFNSLWPLLSSPSQVSFCLTLFAFLY